MAKYLKKYANDLLEGMRKDGKTIVECCLVWGITDSEYNEFLISNKDLQYADQIGEMDCAAWWHSTFRTLAERGNASVLQMGMKNIKKIGWQDRPETEVQEAPPIKALKISILAPRKNDD